MDAKGGIITVPRPIVVHFHIFKNAGTTIDWILQKNFAIDAVKFDDLQRAANIYPPEKIVEMATKYNYAKSLSSHQIRFPLPKADDFTFLPIVFVRHPIDRAVSIYNFTKIEDRDDAYHRLAKSSTLKQFVEANFENKEYTHLKNPQTRWLAQEIKEFNPPLRLARAIEYINSSAIIGVVDRIDESLVVAENILRPFFPKIDMAYISQNVSIGRTGTLEEKLAQIRKEIGDNTMLKLKMRNDLDFQIYEHANKELDRRIEKIERMGEKLSNFRERCNLLYMKGKRNV